MKNIFPWVLLLLVVKLTWASPPSATKVSIVNPEITMLPNGLEIQWYSSPSIPVFDAVLLVRAGHRDDPKGKSGTAELLEFSLERGAGGKTAKDLATVIESTGGSRLISAEEDTITIGVHGLSTDVATLTEILSLLAIKPDFPQQEVERERTKIVDRWTHLGDSADALAGLAISRVARANNSYSRGAISHISEVQKITRADLIEFHRRFFTPANSTLVIVGQYDRKALEPKLAQWFGSWNSLGKPTGSAPPSVPAPVTRTRVIEPDPRISIQPGHILLIDRPGLNQAQIRFAWKAPSIRAPEHFALEVGNALIGEYFNSKLNTVIRDQLGLTYSIASGFNYSHEDANYMIQTSTSNEKTGELIAKTLDVLKRTAEGDIQESEIEMAKQYLQGSFPLSISTVFAIASRRLSDRLFGLGDQYEDTLMDQIQKVKTSEVKLALKNLFANQKPWIVIAGDQAQVVKHLKSEQRLLIKSVKIDALR